MLKKNREKIKDEILIDETICKICGKILESKLCFSHRDATGHTEFRPYFQKLKGEKN